MDKREFIINALKNDIIFNKWWLFALVAYTEGRSPEEDYSIQYDKDGCYGYLDGAWHRIDGVGPNEPLIYPLERLELPARTFSNQPSAIVTTYGNALFNARVLQFAFGDRVEFITGQINIKRLESELAERTVDGSENKDEERQGKITIQMLIMDFGIAVADLNDIMEFVVTASSTRSLVTDPNITKIREAEIEKNKDRLHDTAVIAEIESTLIKADEEWLKGDPAAKFSDNRKAKNARKRMYSMFGAETGFDETGKATLITKSLNEGWDLNALPPMYNSLRAGSFFRGYETALGGESVKFFLSVFQNTAITIKDCGTKLYTTHRVDPEQASEIVGMYERLPNGTFEPITKSRASELVGNVVSRRTPRFCIASPTDYCETCMGTVNSENPFGLGSRASEVGSMFMSIMMAAAHAKALQVVDLDYDNWLS